MKSKRINYTPNKCDEVKFNNASLKINESLEVSIGGVTYGKIKTLIVKNDKMEFTIEIASDKNNL